MLPTTVVGSYSVPQWLERLKNDHLQRRLSAGNLEEIHQVAIKAALKDQEQAEEYRFAAEFADRPVKFSLTGPFSLSRRIQNQGYKQERDLVLGLARSLNAEAHALVEAGARWLQIDEPFLAGYPDQIALAIEAVNTVVDGVDASWALHVCYGNRYARPLWEGHYSFLFPAVLEARVDRLALEFARKRYDDLTLLAAHAWDRQVGLGGLDVKDPQ